MNEKMTNHIEIILFDLGGVLVELVGVPTMLEWTQNRWDVDQLWEAWLQSPAVRAFERGSTAAAQFAVDLISEMELSVEPGDFIEAFTFWPRALYPGVTEMLNKISKNFTLSCLSNSNELHWPRLMNEMELSDKFSYHFASHLTGKLKPDLDAFEHVLKELDCDAEKILFLDDNEINVQGALQAGMNAKTVRGIDEVKQILNWNDLKY
jgi:glucose-1-phosphatase